MAKYSLVMTPTPCRVAGRIISIRPTYSCARGHLLTHYAQLARLYRTVNISERVEDRAKATINGLYKVTINGLYKVVHWLSIAAKMYDLE